MVTQIKDTELQMMLLNTLRTGKENALKMRQIRQIIGVKDERKIRENILDLQNKGKLIVSDSVNGYWLAGSYSEFLEYSNFIHSYIGDMSHKLKVMGHAALEEFGQPRLF